MAHTAANSQRYGVADEKIAQMWEFETSDLFTDAERAALRFAAAAASVPNAVDETLAEDLKRHFNDTENRRDHGSYLLLRLVESLESRTCDNPGNTSP